MKKLLLVFLLLTSVAQAQPIQNDLTGLGVSPELASYVKSLVTFDSDSLNPQHNLDLAAGKSVKVSSTGTLQTAPYVPTMAATPVAATNFFGGGLNVVPTAAANTAAFLPAAPTPGTMVVIYNSGPNAVRAKVGSGDTVNGGTADGYIALATKQRAECEAESGSNWNCALSTVPTPAGP